MYFSKITRTLARNHNKNRFMDIGKILRQKREYKNLTQQEVADYVGVERTTYINWETGISDVKCKYLPKLAEFLNVDVREFFEENSSSILISPNNTDNKDNSINAGVIFFVNDRESLGKIIELVKKRYKDLS